MKKFTSLNWLVPLIGILVFLAAAAGLFWQDSGSPYPFTTLNGDTVQIDGRGLYRNDTIFSASAFRGTDIVMLGVALPLLGIAFLRYRGGSLRGALLLAGALSITLYYGASMTFSAAFNQFFLVYTALFSASLFAFIRILTAIDVQVLGAHVSPQMPRRGLGIFLIITGLATFGLWLSDLVGPILNGTAPAGLGPYTTMFTHGFDSATITPAAVLAGAYLLRRQPLGYLIAIPILILCTVVGMMVISQTVVQTLAGIVFPIGVYIGMIGSWVVMGAFAIWFTAAFFRSLAEPKADGVERAAAGPAVS